MERKLHTLFPGEGGTVTAVCPGELATRLQDLGFTPGTWVCCQRKAPLGDPVAYEIRGAVIALRATDAALVMVQDKAVDTDVNVVTRAAGGLSWH